MKICRLFLKICRLFLKICHSRVASRHICPTSNTRLLNGGNAEKVVAYAAKALSKAERNYSTTRKELLALIWGVEHFAPYLTGKQFMARTDHNALKWIKSFKPSKGQVARWIERLTVFDFEMGHRPGRNHGNTDGVSRIPREDMATKENEFQI